MSAKLVIGSDKPVTTSIRKESSDREATVVIVDGMYSDLEDADPSTYCPSGLVVETSYLETTEGGMGRLTVRCVKYDFGFSFQSSRNTFRIDMQEVTYDLEDHPYVNSVRDKILMWLATEESMRVDGNEYKYKDKEGNLQDLSDNISVKFCKAYMSGIKTFNRYFPVIEKISIWKNPPGMSMSGKSFTGGSPDFSQNVGRYDRPPLNLNGFGDNNWFKSKDSWSQNADTSWTRVEQWTYTPESSSGQNSWIYNT